MTHTRIIGATLLLVACCLACATPNKYVPTDAAPDEATEEGDTSTPAKMDLAVVATSLDAPAPSGDTAGADTFPVPPDGPCGTPTDPRNCGTCGHDCSRLTNVIGTAVSCQAGKCVVAAAACASGYAHCSANVEDGCETSLARPETCGRCDMKCAAGDLCSASGGSYQCVSGCSGGTPDKCAGTCTNLQTDTRNCGSCGHDCGQLANVKSGATVSCQGGHCVIPAASCATGFGHCGSGPPDNGCETNISAPQTCGCGSCSAGQVCRANGSSYQCGCGGGSTKCERACVDLQNDGQNCGGCGHSCLGGPCANGQCQPVQLYAGGDATYRFTFDSDYIYFIRQKDNNPNLNLISRISKVDGSGFKDIWATDIGPVYTAITLVSGTLDWAGENDIMGCPAPACAGGPQVKVANQNKGEVFADVSRSRLFWVADDPAVVGQRNLMRLGVSTPLATSSYGFKNPTADSNFVYANEGYDSGGAGLMIRVSVNGGPKTPLGSGYAPAINSSKIFFDVETPVGPGGASSPAIWSALQSPAGGSRMLVGNYGATYDVWGGLVADEQDVSGASTAKTKTAGRTAPSCSSVL
jgi:hypothetical protein